MKPFFQLDRWHDSQPEEAPDSEGNTVLLRQVSVAPMEVWEWGVGPDGQPYERYAWLEDDFYADASYCRPISCEELLRLLRKKGDPELVKKFERIRQRLQKQ